MQPTSSSWRTSGSYQTAPSCTRWARRALPCFNGGPQPWPVQPGRPRLQHPPGMPDHSCLWPAANCEAAGVLLGTRATANSAERAGMLCVWRWAPGVVHHRLQELPRFSLFGQGAPLVSSCACASVHVSCLSLGSNPQLRHQCTQLEVRCMQRTQWPACPMGLQALSRCAARARPASSAYPEPFAHPPS